MKTATIALLLICTAAFAQQKNTGTFTDARDKKKYKSVNIGGLTWMAENLNYNAESSKCYDNKPANCAKYGRLYDWETAMKVCPDGWRLPRYDEYRVLKSIKGAQAKLKAKSGWNKNGNESGNGTDEYGFSALPGGNGNNGSNNPSSLVGQWELASPGAKGGDVKNIELFKDGTGMVDNMTVSWKVEGKRLTILASMVGQSFEFKISGYELTCIEDDGDISIYVRKGKLEEFKAKLEAEAAKWAAEVAKQAAACADKGFKTVKIGSQTWMAENFNCNVNRSKCYDNDEANCNKYGRLYDRETAMAVCPKGWHLPSKSEYEALDKAVGGKKVAGKKLKAKSGWNSNGNGTDDFGFSALPGGYGSSGGGLGSFGNVGDYGNWWSATKNNSDSAYFRYMGYDDNVGWENWDNYGKSNLLKSRLFSVRCLQDN